MIGLFFDTETNGIKTRQDPNFRLRCVQLGAILQDMQTDRVLSELNLIIKMPPDYKIPQPAINVHGITDDLAAKYGMNHSSVDLMFAALISKADFIVAHNIHYDLSVLKDDMPMSYAAASMKPQFCTMRGSVWIVQAPLTQRQKDYFIGMDREPDYPFKVPSLIETYRSFFNKDFVGAHDAMADIRACRNVFRALIAQNYYQINPDGLVVETGKHEELRLTARSHDPFAA